MGTTWSGFVWGITEEKDPAAYAFLSLDENGTADGDPRGTQSPLERCSDDAYGTAFNYVGVEAVKFEGAVTFRPVQIAGPYGGMCLDSAPFLDAIQVAREKWEGVRTKYMDKFNFDIGEGYLIAIFGRND